MDGIFFETATPPAIGDPARADIACFLGLVGRRHTGPRRSEERDGDYLRSRIPGWLFSWFNERGWLPQTGLRSAESLVDLLDVPVPVDCWDTFDALFAWDRRPLSEKGKGYCDTMLGAGVRSFFAQGGRKCYVIRLGDPWPLLDEGDRRSIEDRMFPQALSPVDRTTWRGIGHLFGLPDVSFLCLPDLPELYSLTPKSAEEFVPADGPESFVECALRTDPPRKRPLRWLPSPRCDRSGFENWSRRVKEVGEFLHRSAPEVQLIGAVPLPIDESTLGTRGRGSQSGPGNQGSLKVKDARDAQWKEASGVQTAFVQLAYPWLGTRDSDALPGGIEPPDGLLAGFLANNALVRNAWRSAQRLPVPRLMGVEPTLPQSDLERDLSPPGGRTTLQMRQRISLFGPTPAGMRLLSDVTTHAGAYRPANINRLMTAILRAARLLGEDEVFENNGEALWFRLKDRMESLLAGMWSAGALTGATAKEAFEVRCDRTTMTQTDIDAGRAIVQISFTAAAPIERITVVLAMSEGGQVSVTRRSAELAAVG